VLGDDWARDHALRTLTLLEKESSAAPDAVTHTPGGLSGLLEDQVFTAAAALDAYEATGDRAWLDWAERLMNRVWGDYWDEAEGGLWDTARPEAEQPGLLPARAKPVQDAPTPSPNGVAGLVAARLRELTGAPRWQERADALVHAFAGRAAELGLYAATYLLALDWQLTPATHLVIIGEEGDAVADRMHRAALAGFIPRRVVQRLAPDGATTGALPPALAAMVSVGRAPCGYACTGTSCSQPAEELEVWLSTLEALRPAVPA
jgi:uncharacterized protein YyaL (SSP411 family)